MLLVLSLAYSLHGCLPVGKTRRSFSLFSRIGSFFNFFEPIKNHDCLYYSLRMNLFFEHAAALFFTQSFLG